MFQSQEIHGYGHVARLTQFFLEQKLWNDVEDLRVGRMSADADGARFMAFNCFFQSLTACGSLPGDLGNGWYNSPVGQYGVVLTVNPAPTWYIRLGALDSTRAALPMTTTH